MALIEHGLFGITDKVQESIDLIKAYEPPEGYYVAFSGGKDSIVTLDLVKRSGVKYDAHYMRAMEPPEVVYFIRQHYPEVQRHLPKKTMWQLIRENGVPPLRTIRYCCRALKEDIKISDRRTVLMGLRWAESVKRRNRKAYEETKYKTKAKTGTYFLSPIISWSNEEVWQYIRDNCLHYPSLYDEGFTRLGCIMCPCGSAQQMQLQATRWPKIALAYRRAMQRAYQPDIADAYWKDGNDMYEWWLSGKSRELEGDMLWDENDV